MPAYFDYNYETDRPVEVRFDDQTVWVTLADRRTIGNPLSWHSWLATATPEQKTKFDLRPFSVDWPDLDNGLDIEGMLRGVRPMSSGRQTTEKKLIAKAKDIPMTPETGCFDAKAIDEFIEAWQDLVAYYETNRDLDINVEVVRDYIHWANRFGEIILAANADLQCLEIVEDASADLEGAMTKIIAVVEKRIYPYGR